MTIIQTLPPSVMLHNIYEQPDVVRRSIALEFDVPDWFLAVERITIVACGSSRHAAMVAHCWIESLARVSVRVLDAGEWCDRAVLMEPGTGVIAISQSGRTKDVLETLRWLEPLRSGTLGLKILSIVNEADSPLVLRSDAAIVTPAFPEGAVAATKSFSAQLVILARLALSLAEAKGMLTPTELQVLRSDLSQLPDAMAKTLKGLGLGLGTRQSWMTSESVVLLGRGLQTAIALEGALKLKETCYVHAEGFGAGDFCHGPMAIVSPSIPVIALLPDEKMRADLERFRSWGSPIVTIDRRRDDAIDTPMEFPIEFPVEFPVESVVDWLMPFVTVLPLQLLAYDWAISKGLDVDQPRYLTKFIG